MYLRISTVFIERVQLKLESKKVAPDKYMCWTEALFSHLQARVTPVAAC